jgi:hypothetical protein
MTAIVAHGSNVSTAWLAAVTRMLERPERQAFHTVVTVDAPTAEQQDIRDAADAIMINAGLPAIETVANTIFPKGIANSSRTHTELVERYVRMMPVLRKFEPNKYGTYFGRLIQYPGKDGPVDQVGAVIRRIDIERATPGPKKARYEASLDDPDALMAVTAPVYVPGRDNKAMAFPCLSHCSFQMDNRAGRLHLMATYRSQYLLQRGYGNYLGLGRLLAYVAGQAGLQVGQLTIVAGIARVENPILPLRALVRRFAAPAHVG